LFPFVKETDANITTLGTAMVATADARIKSR
jgi:hypothetical protein